MNSEFILIGLIILFAAFTQGFSGFGFQLISISLLSLLVDIKHVIPMCAMFGLVINVYLVFLLKAHIQFGELKSLIIGSCLGIPVGVYILSETSTDVIKLLMGIILLIFVFLSSVRFIKDKHIDSNWGYIFGVISGILGGILNTNGPPILIYFFLKGWEKIRQKAFISGYFLFSSTVIVIAHAVSGITSKFVLKDFLIFLPFVLIGQAIGAKTFKGISSDFYNKIILFFLGIIGLILIVG